MKYLLIAALAFVTCSVLAQTSSTPAEFRMDFVKVSPGEFMMGCSTGDIDCNDDERPLHHVQITKPYEIGKYEVTQAQWQAVMGSNPSTMKGENRPVETVSKSDAQAFLNKLNQRNDGFRYRLPTEAEWEYAARAGSNEQFTGKLDDIGWYAGNSEDETHPVGQKKPNAWGLYDMQGNVRELVSDGYSANYYRNSPAADPTGPAPGQGGGRGPDGGRGDGGRGFRGGRGPGGFRGGPAPNGNGENTGQAVQSGQPAQRGGFQGRGGPGGFGQRRGGPGGRGQLPVMRGGAWDQQSPFLRISARYAYYGDTLHLSDVGFRVVRGPQE
jgi:formylglycine-generating enzyme required for sulfatase activity